MRTVALALLTDCKNVIRWRHNCFTISLKRLKI